MTLGERIKDQRKALKLTQDDLAQAVGVTATAVSMWEKNRRRVPPTHYGVLSQALNIPLEELYYPPDTPTQSGKPCYHLGTISMASLPNCWFDRYSKEAPVNISEFASFDGYIKVADSSVSLIAPEGALLFIRFDSSIENANAVLCIGRLDAGQVPFVGTVERDHFGGASLVVGDTDGRVTRLPINIDDQAQTLSPAEKISAVTPIAQIEAVLKFT